MSSKKKATEKKAPSTPTSTTSKKEVASPTPRSTAMAAMPFYDTVEEISIPKMDDKTRDFMLARGVVDDVFNNEEKEKAYGIELDSAFNNPPFTESDMSQMAAIDYLKGRREDLQDLEKMEEGVRMANRGKEIMRMSPQQRELEVADELLNLKEAVPGLDKDIGDRSTPIPEIDENMFEGTPVRKSKRIRKKGGMPRLKDTGVRRGGGPTKRTLAVTQKEMKESQAVKFLELLGTKIAYKDAETEFQKYLKDEVNQPELFGKKLRMEMFLNIERGLADDPTLPELESHIVKDQSGGKRTRRRKQTKRKRHLKKSTKSRKTKRRKRRTLKK